MLRYVLYTSWIIKYLKVLKDQSHCDLSYDSEMQQFQKKTSLRSANYKSLYMALMNNEKEVYRKFCLCFFVFSFMWFQKDGVYRMCCLFY